MRLATETIDVHYDVCGEGPWLIMSHSLACDMHMWDEEARRLSKNYKVLRFDTRGHGKSDAPEGFYSIELLTKDLWRLVKKLNINEAHFIGLSMGGMIGQALTLMQPNFVKSLILCATTSEMEFNLEERIKAVRRNGMRPMVNPTIERFLSLNFQKTSPDVVQQVEKTIVNTSVAGYIGCCAAIADMSFKHQLGDIECPTLIVVGEGDIVTPIAMAKNLKCEIPNSELLVIPEASHLVNLEQPDLFYSAVSNFLRKI